MFALFPPISDPSQLGQHRVDRSQCQDGLKGEVAGVNTAIYSPSGGSIGIAFDIPSATAKAVAEQLEAKGVVIRGWIGVSVQPVTGDIVESLGVKEAKGALIDGVQQNGPAAKAGLANGDLILSLDGAEVKDAATSLTANGSALH